MSIQPQEIYNFLIRFLQVYIKDVVAANYLHLIATLTYVNYDAWSNPDYAYSKGFLLHCFYSFVGEKYEHSSYSYPSIDSIKNNALLRIALIKLVGYMSFCPEFQTDEITRKSVPLLLDLSKQYKSLNSIVKISWGLSNWSKVANFSTALS